MMIIIIFYNPKLKKLNSGHDCFWYMLIWLHPFGKKQMATNLNPNNNFLLKSKF
jgi:hypothetical protein